LIASISCGFAVDAPIQQVEVDNQSKILNLSSALPVTANSEMPITIENPYDTKSDKEKRNKLALGLLAGTAVAFAIDKSVGEYSDDNLNGKTTVRLADFFNDLGGKNGLGLVSAGYFIGDDESKRTCGMAFQAAIEAALITQSIKFLVGRERPSQSDGEPYEFNAQVPVIVHSLPVTRATHLP
jgi:hypothetical protein